MTILLLYSCTSNGTSVKPRKRVTKRTNKARTVAKKASKVEASARGKGRPRYLPEELAGMYRPVKRPVTLRLDADILAWFQRDGSGYQTRINQALRKMVMQERKGSRR